ncbi:hypothetical protein AMAG_19712 [Allomyces macrogynus ATCC 38327]|uniref:Uncharacterized protein n=1 Tax=Allomyces macrogynus (strain ATCC 38327) TaxID=578462 RepID=A0A0L0SZ25_ALLM3|nr:hypothetical protein AMAG_19712 [Allomyces macrogynus ATCC 38327]|eukprot:KNE67813.1 hypothetical protein AMAG_19712 [Allomyces macrogynus ATCC 38327]
MCISKRGGRESVRGRRANSIFFNSKHHGARADDGCDAANQLTTMTGWTSCSWPRTTSRRTGGPCVVNPKMREPPPGRLQLLPRISPRGFISTLEQESAWRRLSVPVSTAWAPATTTTSRTISTHQDKYARPPRPTRPRLFPLGHVIDTERTAAARRSCSVPAKLHTTATFQPDDNQLVSARSHARKPTFAAFPLQTNLCAR